jgi:hypothetical protein
MITHNCKATTEECNCRLRLKTMENPEHKESAEGFIERVKSQYPNFTEGELRTYGKLLVKEAREQDIKEMRELYWVDKDGKKIEGDCNEGIDGCISILESKLEGGEKI